MPYLIDGNNLLGSWGGPRAGDDRRAEVVQRVVEFCRARGAKATLVFDGRPLRSDLAAQTLGSVAIRVPPPGQDADTLIREIVDRSTRPQELIVVTSDKPLYSYARTRGASVLRAHEWNAEERRRRGPKRAGPSDDSEKPQREQDVAAWLKKFGASE
ncbi:MAG TPA: NYN domain-containing protein [Vicinamibacteria bacterium]|nr:NYN domain-containing protein [Vicinamibacteria bacterium]